MLYLFSLFSDACDPKWRNTRDGLIGSGFAASILVVIFSSSVVLFHICWHISEGLQLHLCTVGCNSYLLIDHTNLGGELGKDSAILHFSKMSNTLSPLCR